MTKLASLAAAFAALLVVGAALAISAKTVSTYKATLTPGTEVPKAKAPAAAKGLFTATVTVNAGVRTMRWKLTFGGLSGKAVAAHVHKGKAGVAGGVLLALCGPCKTGQAGQTRISKGVVDALERGVAYVNVHTARNAGGETRGQVKLIEKDGAASTDPATTTTTPDYGGGGDDPPGY